MTTDELHTLMRRLMAAYPGEWDIDRIAVWSEVLLPLDPAAALAAVKAMTLTERFPTLAALAEHIRRTNPPRLAEHRRALPRRADRDAVVRSITDARSHLTRQAPA